MDRYFQQLVLSFQQRLYAFALRQTGSLQDAEDIVQEAFIRAYHALADYPAERIRVMKLQTWLYKITLHIFYRHSRGSRLQFMPLDLSADSVLLEIEDDDDLIARLKSDDWEVRVAAVRALGKLNTGASLELLASALDDEDGSVRAAAVHALGNVGKQAPLQQLMVALRDSDWHVRETAVLALGKQEPRVPDEVLTIALYDRDISVREAARLALQCHTAGERTSASYRGLQEQKIMQHDRDDTSLPNGGEAMPGNAWHDSMEYSERSREQVQEYASYDYGNAMSLQGEKVTIHPQHRSQRGWWVIVVIVAILFFLLGNMTQRVMPVRVPGPAIFMMHHQESSLPFESPSYATILQKDVARGLNLSSPKEITAQLKAGKSMTDIAATQGVSVSQLQSIELSSLVTTQVPDSSPPTAARVFFAVGFAAAGCKAHSKKPLANHRRW